MPIVKTQLDLQEKIEKTLSSVVMKVDNGQGGEDSYNLFVDSSTPGFVGNTGVSGDPRYTEAIPINNASGMKAIITGISEAIISHICEELEIIQHERYDKLEEDYNTLLSQMINVVTQLNLAGAAFVAGTVAPTTLPLAAVGPLLLSTATALQATIDAGGTITRQAATEKTKGEEVVAGNVVK